MTGSIDVLVVEDGDEYLTNLSTFVGGDFSYRQAKSGEAAKRAVASAVPDIVYLDMRFDRIPESELLGNIVELSARFNGDVSRARRFQQDNQGMFILRGLRESGYVGPVILSYDFSTEERRFRALSARDPALYYCPDYADAATIRAAMCNAIKIKKE